MSIYLIDVADWEARVAEPSLAKASTIVRHIKEVRETFVRLYLEHTPGATVDNTMLVEQRDHDRINFWCEPRIQT